MTGIKGGYCCAAVVAVMLAGASTPAIAADDTVKQGPLPAWAHLSKPLPAPDDGQGTVFFEYQDSIAHLDAKGQSQLLAYRVKLLNPAALQIGNVSIEWNPAAGAPVVHHLLIHRDGTTIDVLKEAKFEVIRREDKLEQSMLSGRLTAVLRVPDLRVGDELEFAVTIRDADPTLGGENSGVWTLAEAPSPGRFHFDLSWDEGEKPQIRLTPNLAAIAQKTASSVGFTLDNPGPLPPPKDAPPRYQFQRLAEYSDFANWGALAAKFAPLYQAAAKLAPDSPLIAETRRIAAAYPDAMGRAEAALKLVQQQVRYVYVGLGNGNLTPATADETWKRRYGDCKGKTTLLLALLAQLGINSEPVLVNSSGLDDGLDQRLPNPAFFDHVLVRATIDGKAYWLDGTLPPVAMPSIDPAFDSEWVLPLVSNNEKLMQIVWHPLREPSKTNLYEIDARAGFDKPAKITATTITRGLPGLIQYSTFSAASPAQLENSLRNNLAGSTAWNTVDSVKWHYDVPDQASILTITGTSKIDWDDDGDGAKSLSLVGGGFSPPDRRAREAGQDQKAPYYNKPDYDCDATTIRLPSDTKDVQWSYNTTYDQMFFGKEYYRQMELRDHTIRMVRGFRVEQREIDAKVAARDNARLDDFDNSKASISFDPKTDSKDFRKNGQHVPATWEIDWTKPGAPCLPKDLLSEIGQGG